VLTINADDLGRSEAETDSALTCLREGCVTSTTAMVFMEDSARAFERVRGTGWDVGLHLNLTEPFTAADVPVVLRQRQVRLAKFLRSSRYASVLFHPLLSSDFDYVVKAQLDAFARSWGRPVQRLDGHQHMHLATNVLWQRLLPEGIRVRRSFSFDQGARSRLNLWYRRRVDASLERRHRLSDRFYALPKPSDAASFDALRRTAAQLDVELMTHPVRPAEFGLLVSDEFRALLRAVDARQATPSRDDRRYSELPA
jgi:chitin disaccharide deacetylase